MFSKTILFAVAALAYVGYAHSACGPQGYPTGNHAVKVKPDTSGRTRTYNVYVPKNYKNTEPVSLLMTFAGLGAPCGDISGIMKPEVDARGIIMATPCGSQGALGTAWNSGTCCGFLNTSKVDDFAFTKVVLADVQKKLCIDPAKIFVAGFSNGAMMAEVLACKMNGVFRAAASVSGVVEIRPGMEKGLAACDVDVAASTNRTSILNVHGTADPLVPWGGDPVLGFPKIPEDLQRWVKRNGCNPEGKETFHKGKFNNTLWTGCQGGGRVELVRSVGGGHTWPRTKDFNTTTHVWSFFDAA